jgi:O-antigen/teichoic acid export membrane protein
VRLSERSAGVTNEAAHRAVRSLARGGTLNVVGLIASGALQLLVVVIVTRGLGTSGAGLFLEAVALFMILSNIGELGADTGLVRAIPRYMADGHLSWIPRVTRVAIVPVLVFGFMSAIAVYLTAPQLAAVFFHGINRSDAVLYLRVLAPFIPLASATTVVLSGTRGFGTMVPYVLVQNIGMPVARPLLILLAIAAGYGGIAIALGWTIPAALGCLAAALSLRALVQRRLRERVARSSDTAPPPRRIWAEFWRFAGPRALATVFGIAVTWLDILLVGGLRSTKEAGIYAAASRLAIIGAYLLSAVGMAVTPQISALLARNDPEGVQDVYQTATWWLILVSWPLYLTLAVFAPLLMRIFGAGFTEGADALAIVSVGMLVNLATGNVLSVLLMAGKSSWNLLNASVSLVINIGLNLVLIPKMGITGAAIAWATSIVFVNVAALLEMLLLLKVRPFGFGYWIAAGLSLGCFGLAAMAVRQLGGLNVPLFIVFLATAGLIYGLLLWRFRRGLRLDVLRNALRRGTAAPGPQGIS